MQLDRCTFRLLVLVLVCIQILVLAKAWHPQDDPTAGGFSIGEALMQTTTQLQSHK